MSYTNSAILAFNRGLVSRLGMARVDLKRMALSAEIQTNFMPRVLGSMMLRPGLQYVADTRSDALAKGIAFQFSTTDLANIELTDLTMRVFVGVPSDTLISRGAVQATVTNGTFAGSLTGWTNADQSGALSRWITDNFMELTGTGTNSAIQRQQVTIALADVAKEHALRVVVAQAPITIRVGSSSGTDDYLRDRRLGVGTHSLSLTPLTDFWIEFRNAVNTPGLVHSVAVEAAGVMTLPTPWPASVLGPISLIRYDQSGDVIYVACSGYAPQKIMRTYGSTNPRSWSIVAYQPEDGPFKFENTGAITITPSATTGSVTLTASDKLFRTGHAGALFRLDSVGQHASVTVGGTGQWSAAVKVTGIGDQRNLGVSITSAGDATIQLQRSVGSPGAWTDVPAQSWVDSNVTTSYLDGLDNQIIYYRIGCESDYTSGSPVASLDITTGSLSGIVRITSVSSSTSAAAIVLTEPNPSGSTSVLLGLGSTTATPNWWEGQWSDLKGWPTSVALYEGRIFWAGHDAIVGSVSDAFESFDNTVEGDSGPINRTIGSGPVDTINWLLGLQRLIIGAQGAEKSARSSSFDSPLTPTDFIIKNAATQGSAAIAAVAIDSNGVFVDKSLRRVYQVVYSPNGLSLDYTASDLTKFVPDIAITPGGFTKLAVQRKPDTRIHGIMADGTAAVLVFDQLEDEMCWVKIETDGIIEDVIVQPGAIEDLVYYIVKRTVNGATVRYWEKWAREDQCQGGTANYQADAFITGTQAASATISGLGIHESEDVIVWADGKDYSPGVGDDQTVYRVSSGAITLGAAVETYVVGRPYVAQFKSTKLSYGAQLGTALNQMKLVRSVGLILADTHAQGLQYGPDFVTLDDLPQIERGAQVDQDSIWDAYDEDMVIFPGSWGTDSRVCLQATAPRPCTALALVVGVETHESA